MPKYRITSPEGATFEVTAPDSASEAEVMAYARKNFDSHSDAPSTKPAEWADLPGNIIPSAGRFMAGIGQTVLHPIDTLSGVADAAAGGLRNLTPEPLRNLIDKADASPENQRRATATADAVGKFYKDRYGGLQNLKQTVITDPVGAAADLSTVLAGAGGAANVANLPRVGNALAEASRLTNPITAMTAVAKPVAKAGGVIASNLLGMTSGVGPENVRQAAAAGFKGPRQGSSFWDNLSGKADPVEVLDAAKEGIANMGRQKAAEYRANMAAVSGDRTVLDFAGVDKALNDAANVASFKGQVTNDRAASALQQINADVAKWKSLDPAEFHTPEGMDALKQRVGGVLESIPFEEKTARLAAGKVYNAIKSEIVKQAPAYADAMKSYSDASELIREIERALSLGQKSAADTAMRKLQSLSRNNASTNYGNRLNLAKQLEAQGGVDILPAIAGQAMNTWTPRGLSGQIGGMATLGGTAAINPQLAALLPLQSPKAVGLMSYGAGRVAGVADRGLDAFGLGPQNALMLYQLNQLKGP